ncbi:MAG: hypothetical protein LUD29_05495 [Clostridia bacterium]|nr:hypothetical protein [Clostridia bacterium]
MAGGASRIDSYIGFAIKAGKVVYGGEMVSRETRGVQLVIVSAEAQKNTLKVAQNAARRFSCPVVMCAGLEDKLGRQGCKICAIKEASLAKAIATTAKESDSEGYSLYIGGADGEKS